jgi:NAD(P)H dehydrogenase (quinone)
VRDKKERMNVLYVYCHPLPESFHGAIRAAALAGLSEAGHAVDLCDLHAEKFDPVMSADERRDYHDLARNQSGVEEHVRRLRAADALVLQFPVWSFGPPAMLKGWMDRLLMPGVAFDLSDPNSAIPLLTNLRRIAGITTYGRPWWNALFVGDPPKKIVRRYMPRFTNGARVDYYPLYHMNVASDAQRKAFMAKVRAAMARF